MGISSSLFGAMQASVYGINAQAGAISYISDNIANSQTTGYKRVEARFGSYITASDAVTGTHVPGSTTVTAFFNNSLQGGVVQSQTPTNFAISGNGFVEVSQQIGSGNTSGFVDFEDVPYYTRKCDFVLDRFGYLRNSSGAVLKAWPRNATTGAVSQVATEVQIINAPLAPSATANVVLSANLPASSKTQAFAAGAPQFLSTYQIYDSLGNAQNVKINWTHVGSNSWAIEVEVPGATQTFGNSNATFNFNTSGTVTTGTSNMFTAGGTQNNLIFTTIGVNGTTHNALKFTANGFPGAGTQTITIDIGPNTGSTNTITQYNGTTLDMNTLRADGYSVGEFKSVNISADGLIGVNYSNGRVVSNYQIPIVDFADPEKLNRIDGDMFAVSIASGPGTAGLPNQARRGTLVSSSLESSNVDLADEFTKMIQAQRVYTANTKMVNVVDEMLQEVVNLKR